jgi:hypothetical protein
VTSYPPEELDAGSGDAPGDKVPYSPPHPWHTLISPYASWTRRNNEHLVWTGDDQGLRRVVGVYNKTESQLAARQSTTRGSVIKLVVLRRGLIEVHAFFTMRNVVDWGVAGRYPVRWSRIGGPRELAVRRRSVLERKKTPHVEAADQGARSQ